MTDSQNSEIDKHVSLSEHIISDLAKVDVHVSDLSNDLLNHAVDYSDGVNVLAQWIKKINDDASMKELLIRAIGYKGAPDEAFETLLDEFAAPPPADAGPSYRWAIGSAINLAYRYGYDERIIALIEDPMWGSSRELLVELLWRMQHPRAIEVAAKLLRDESVCHYAARSLRRRLRSESAGYFRTALDDPSTVVRECAARELERLRRGESVRKRPG